MLAVVIPVLSEAATIELAVARALRLPGALVIPVLNGCTDMTPAIVGRMADRRIRPLHFREPLGYDVPRIAGARAALAAGASGVLFADGDLKGPIEEGLARLADSIRRGADLALTDCYAETPIPSRASAAQRVFKARLALNRALGRVDLGAAIPSHGPVAVSRRLLETLAPASPGVPPLMQAEAARAALRIEVAARIPHVQLGSARRSDQHRLAIAETIIGDCRQAICSAEGRPADRDGHLGYHPQRRFDLLGLTAPESSTPAGAF